MLLVYALALFIFPLIRVYIATGLNPVSTRANGTAQNNIERIMLALIMILFPDIICFSFFPQLYKYLLPISILQAIPFKIAGLTLSHSALIWIAIAQYQMHDSWRIGIDDKNESALITKGLFGISRSPIFIGILVALSGLFLIIPDAVTLILMGTSLISIQIQIRSEEKLLSKQFGNDYMLYCKKVKRFF